MSRIVLLSVAGPGTQFFALPNQPIPEQTEEVDVPIGISMATSLFAGATGWLNASSLPDQQPFSFRDLVANPNPVSRQIDYRFNQFSLVGNCCACGVVIEPKSNGFGQGGVFPSKGLYAYGPVGHITAGTLFGQEANEAKLYIEPEDCEATLSILEVDGLPAANESCCCEPKTEYTLSISFEALSGSLYTITIDAEDVPPRFHYIDVNIAP